MRGNIVQPKRKPDREGGRSEYVTPLLARGLPFQVIHVAETEARPRGRAKRICYALACARASVAAERFGCINKS